MFRGNFPRENKTSSKKAEKKLVDVSSSTHQPTRHLKHQTMRQEEKQILRREKRLREKNFEQSRNEIRDEKDDTNFWNPELDAQLDQIMNFPQTFGNDEMKEFDDAIIKDYEQTVCLYEKRKYGSREPVSVVTKNCRKVTKSMCKKRYD